MTDKPTALRLADSIEAAVEVGRYSVGGVADCAAAELRRLHAENEKFREAAQQALEALTVYDGTNGESKRKRVLAALRAALAEPTGKPSLQVEPVAWITQWANQNDDEAQTDWERGYEAARATVRCHLEVDEWFKCELPTDEDIMQLWKECCMKMEGASRDLVLVPRLLLERASESLGAFISDHGWAQADMDVMDDIDGTLAASCARPAPQRQPLTEDEAWDMWDALADRGKKGEDIVLAFTRAIEKAHGIGGQE